MTVPPPIHSSPHRLRYLAAMGIDVWIRRGPDDAATAETAEQAPDAAAVSEPAVDTATGGSRGAAQEDVARLDPEQPETVQALRDAVEHPDASAARASAEAPDEDAAQLRVPHGTTEPSGPVPNFRLRVLALGAGMLLVDEAMLESLPREGMQRLGDLLRTGCLLRGVDHSGKVESQTFFWPQLDLEDVDQSMPRAVEALSAFVRRRAETEGFFLVLVQPPGGLLDHPAGEPLAALDVLPVARARLAPAFLFEPGTDADRAAWAALLRMAGAGREA